MTDKELEMVNQHMNRHAMNRSCAACGFNNVQPRFIMVAGVPSVKWVENGTIKTIPCYVLNCQQCGHLSFFHSEMVEGPEIQTETLDTEEDVGALIHECKVKVSTGQVMNQQQSVVVYYLADAISRISHNATIKFLAEQVCDNLAEFQSEHFQHVSNLISAMETEFNLCKTK